MSERQLSEDIEWTDTNKLGTVRQDKEFAGMVPDLEQWDRVEESHSQTIDSAQDRQEQQFEYHRNRTTRNYDHFIREYMMNTNKSSLMSITCGYKLELKEVVTNNAMTVAYVFWDYRVQLEQDKLLSPSYDKKIARNLVSYAKRLRGVMTQRLGLKYAPDIRFVKSEREQ